MFHNLFGLFYYYNSKKTSQTKVHYKIFTLKILTLKDSPTFKGEAGKIIVFSVNVVGTACFHRCFLLGVITGRLGLICIRHSFL